MIWKQSHCCIKGFGKQKLINPKITFNLIWALFKNATNPFAIIYSFFYFDEPQTLGAPSFHTANYLPGGRSRKLSFSENQKNTPVTLWKIF